MRSAAEIRSDFLLSPDVAHLNHGSFGATPRPVLDHQLRIRHTLERSPVEFLARRLPDELDRVRRELAAYLGVADPAALVLLRNSTAALNAVAMSFPFRAGDEIVVTDHEYGAMRLLWDEISATRRVRVVVAHVPLPAESSGGIADAVWSAVTTRTRVLFLSHVTSETALVLPVGELCRRAREAGITTVVDGAHVPGQLDLELDLLGADCYAGNGHKWLCAPKGSAFLYASEEARSWLRPPVVSWGRDGAGSGAYTERFAWSGTDDPSAVLCLPAAIAYQAANDWPAQRERCRDLAQRTQATAIEAYGGAALARSSLQAPQMVTFPIDDTRDAAAVQAELFDRFRIEIPVLDVAGRRHVRLPVQAYTSEEECERLVVALAAISASTNAKSR